jgi:acyl-CoA reductase-like NAD-dependent aldehyde dehydrogenase
LPELGSQGPGAALTDRAFGGVKSSGVGREGGDEALRFFTEARTVCIKYPA